MQARLLAALPADPAARRSTRVVRGDPVTEFTSAAKPVEPVVVSCDPARVLLGWTDSAPLAVVASRRTGRLHDALLGSVSS